ncbi:unnamed protein product [Camellia sinensis]
MRQGAPVVDPRLPKVPTSVTIQSPSSKLENVAIPTPSTVPMRLALNIHQVSWEHAEDCYRMIIDLMILVH